MYVQYVCVKVVHLGYSLLDVFAHYIREAQEEAQGDVG